MINKKDIIRWFIKVRYTINGYFFKQNVYFYHKQVCILHLIAIFAIEISTVWKDLFG